MKIAALALALACLLAAMLALAGCGGGHEPMAANAVEWGYDGPGSPEQWASLSDEYAPCASGKQQSPVDITGCQTGDAGQISFSYSGDAKVVRNDGKFVDVDYGPGNTLGVGHRSYELQSAHLHSPSEHRIDGMSFAAELHLVHADADGALAAVALLFEQGAPSPVVQAILRSRSGGR